MQLVKLDAEKAGKLGIPTSGKKRKRGGSGGGVYGSRGFEPETDDDAPGTLPFRFFPHFCIRDRSQKSCWLWQVYIDFACLLPSDNLSNDHPTPVKVHA